MKWVWLRLALAIIICTASLAWVNQPGKADVAPQPPPKGVSIEPGAETTNVRMMAETVNMVVASYSVYATGLANVTATFHMRNLGDKEEKMDVRFPLDATEFMGNQPGWFDLPPGIIKFPPLEDFTAQVDGEYALVYYTQANVDDSDGKPILIPAWANFPVSFPPGKDVNITVKYIQRGFATSKSGAYKNNVIYSYILYSGAGWKDTIGSADINVVLPIPANDMTVIGKYPNNVIIAGNEIHWHFEDFEPSADAPNGEIETEILQPSYYFAIQDAQKEVNANPQDGDAWGKLARAYKYAGMEEYGFRGGSVGNDMFQKSVDAYQRALALLPDDDLWHSGFADLMCHEAYWGSHFLGLNSYLDELAAETNTCRSEVKRALELNPDNQDAKSWVPILGRLWDPRTPTSTPFPTETNTPGLPPTYTVTSTFVVNSSTSAPTKTATPKPTLQSSATTKPQPGILASTTPPITPVPPNDPNSSGGVWPVGIGIFAVILAAAGVIIWRRSKSQ